ncbi:MAG: flippase-like domain-containing protein [Trueperaceae bacterium]|nr:flippase-like domain-containing protein [Trueperaceae bacterium]
MAGTPEWLRRVLPWVVFAASIAATVVVVRQRGEDFELLAALDVRATLLLVVLQGVYLVVQSGRFHVVLVKLGGARIEAWPWLRLFVLGRFLNLFLPQAGNVYRGVELKRRFGVGYTRFVAAFANAPWTAMVLNFGIGAAVVALTQPAERIGPWPLGLLLACAAFAAALVPFALVPMLRLIPRRFRLLEWLHVRLSETLHVTLASLRDRVYLGRVLAWTLAAFVQAVVMLWVCFSAFGVEVGLAEAVAFYVLLQLATYLVVTPGNLGVQELAFAGLATSMGAAAVEGIAVSGLLRVTGVMALLLLALPFGGVEALRTSRSTRHA